jgi:hypothetical protein
MDAPALLIDLDVVEKSITTMAKFSHGKKADLGATLESTGGLCLLTSRSNQVPEGQCCQKVRQGDYGRIRNILLSNVVATMNKVERLVGTRYRGMRKRGDLRFTPLEVGCAWITHHSAFRTS